MGDDHPNAVERSTTDSAETPAHAESDASTERWVESLDDPLPDDVQQAVERFLGADDVETLGDWAAVLRDLTGGGLDVEDLCHASEATAHYGETGGDRHYFACFYDAVVLAALTDSAVDVHTESPDGTVVEAAVDESGAVTASPPEAVFSLGVSEDASAAYGDRPTHADVYGAVCPYVRAFPSVAAYEAWAADAPAATVAVPLEGATGFTEALLE